MGQTESKSELPLRKDDAHPLHVVARKGHYDLACHILSLGMENVNRQDARGRSPLFWATEYRQESLVELLLAHSADLGVRDKKGNLCLHWAASVGSAPITRMLLKAGSGLNVQNYKGDCPLHVAAQERRYECIVLLLAHGAKVDLKNKAGLTPLHCARVGSPSWNTLHAFSSLPPSPGERILSRDISRGFEPIPIPCLNGLDDEPCPSDFLYVTQNVVSDSVAVPAAALERSQHCDCPGSCSTACCPCVSRSKCPGYTMDGRLVPGTCDSAEAGTVFECNVLCSCASSCPNRVVQKGIRTQLQLFRISAKGWGVRTVQDVPRGAFVCPYLGEVISSAEASQRQDDAYIFVVNTQAGEECCLDGRFYGNIGRFLNHSCQPNLMAVQVAGGREVPSIGLFSTRHIQAGEELGFDYGDKFWEVKGKGCGCLCGSPTCRYQAPRQVAAFPAAAGDVSEAASGGTQRHPLRGFALKSKRMNPLKVITRSQRTPEPSGDPA